MKRDKRGRIAVTFATILLCEISLICETSAVDRRVGAEFITRSPVYACNGMAATSQPLATMAAVDILKSGGNAIDAAIAANAVLCVTEPTGCGLGGDLFAIVWDDKTQQLYGLNASGRSPRSLSLEDFKQRGLKRIPSYGPLPISVPGCVDGWAQLHIRFGKLTLEEILAPSIRYAREGFPVTPVIADRWAAEMKLLSNYPGFGETFLIEGRSPKVGEIFRNPMLADTLTAIAANGRDIFYKGRLAHAIDQFCLENDCYLSYEDLKAHQSEWVDPISVDYRGYDVWELPPNGQGIAALQMLQLLSTFDLKVAGFGSANHLHWFLEAKKLAFEDRAKFYADLEFANVPIAGLISPEYAKKRRKLIQNQSAGTNYSAGNPALTNGDTVYLAVADQNRNMVSLIQSNFRGFGSGLCPTGLGFCLQNRGELFNLQQGQANSYASGKRPFHTIIPAFLTKESQPVMAFGVMGGDMQPQGHVQILMNLLDFGMDLQEAGDAPRVRHFGSSSPTGDKQQSSGGLVQLERGFETETTRELLKRGHRLSYGGDSFGGYQAIWYDRSQGVYIGASESRKDGMAAGY